ncbi:hypothetical protein [Breoghania sp.]|uniref:hypothetical protein n=1 Tax=Breoghania sp. TaxID=2065378 RepID=UPI002AA8C7B6|nr:hypothetical protein [Breoghania sp.]
MIGKPVLAGLVALQLAGFLTLSSAHAEKISSFKIGNWEGGAYTHSQTGEFSHCAASASYRSGITLIFSIHKDLNWALGLVNKKWKLDVGKSYPVRYWVDRRRDYSGTAEVISSNQVKVALPGDDRLFSAVRHGRQLTVLAANDEMKFSLTTTNRMLSRLFDCARTWRKRDLNTPSNPFSDGGASDNPFSTDTEEDNSNPFGSDRGSSTRRLDVDMPLANAVLRSR